MGTAYNTNVVTDGLISCWDAGNRKSYPGTGLDWTDLAGGANGTITNNGSDHIDFIDEKGGYLDFDGGDDYVACPQPNYDTTGDWSWCMWLNRKNSGGFPLIFGYGVNEGTRVFWYNSGSNVILGIYSQESSGPQPPVNDRFPVDEWCMFALKKEGNSLYFCFDADEWTEYTRSSGNWGSDEFIWRDIGKGHTSYYWNGYIASVHMYNRGISLDEVKQNYNATKSRFEPRITKSGMFANWDAGDPESYSGGTTWKDIANTNDATLTNDIVFNSSNGGSLVFDGTDSKATTTLTDQLGDFTVCAWFSQDALTLHARLVDKNYQTGFWLGYSGSNNEWGGGIRETSSPYGIYVQLTEDWNFIAMTRSGSTQTVYGNGTSTTATQSCSSTALDTEPLRIGISADQHTGSGGAHYFEGKIALVRLYNRGLSAAEILDNYNATKARFGH